MRLSSFGLAFSLASLAVAAGSAACSSNSDPPPATPAPDGGATTADGATGDSAAAGTCGATTSYLECRFCCGLADDAVAEAYAKSQEAFQECLCEGPCKDVCATTGCSRDPDAGATTPDCDTCLRADANGKTCFPVAQAECDKAPACKDFQACDLAAQCRAKAD